MDIAASSPSDCFDAAIEACRIAIQQMTPVILLTDGFIANGEEPWPIPDVASLPRIEISHPRDVNGNGEGDVFLPYKRNDRLVRPWALPGTPKLQHRIGGLEKQDVTGNVNYEPANHQHMIDTRARKVELVAQNIPPQAIMGPEEGDVLVIGWGGTYGALKSAVLRVQAQGKKVAHCHIRHLNPFPANLGEIMGRYRKVLVPELNRGQLLFILRATYLVDAIGLNKVQGKPFLISEVENKINEILGGL